MQLMISEHTFDAEPAGLTIAKTLIRGLSDSDRDRLLTWLAATFVTRGRLLDRGR